MNENIFVAIGLILRGMAIALYLGFVFDKQFREAKIVNGIAKLRKILLIGGLVYCVSIVIPFLLNIFNSVFNIPYYSGIQTFINSLGDFLGMFILFRIYKLKFRVSRGV